LAQRCQTNPVVNLTPQVVADILYQVGREILYGIDLGRKGLVKSCYTGGGQWIRGRPPPKLIGLAEIAPHLGRQLRLKLVYRPAYSGLQFAQAMGLKAFLIGD
jgi:hypothetical protein